MNFLEELEKISLAIEAVEPRKQRFNPRPPGIVREGSASSAILEALRNSPGFKTEAQLRWITGRSHSAVSWSLLYLIRQGLVEVMPEICRNSRYQKYRIKVGGKTDE